jgi:peroxiredoxin
VDGAHIATSNCGRCKKALPEIKQLVAISPQAPDESLSTAEKDELAFAVLSDIGSATAKAYGIAFDLAE